MEILQLRVTFHLIVYVLIENGVLQYDAVEQVKILLNRLFLAEKLLDGEVNARMKAWVEVGLLFHQCRDLVQALLVRKDVEVHDLIIFFGLSNEMLEVNVSERQEKSKLG